MIEELYPPQLVTFRKASKNTDTMGGSNTTYSKLFTMVGYLDMLSGDRNTIVQNMGIEESTHVFITKADWQPEGKFAGTPAIGQMFLDSAGKNYLVTYVDDPLGIGHHYEIMARFASKGVR